MTRPVRLVRLVRPPAPHADPPAPPGPGPGIGKSNAWLAIGVTAWALQTLKRLATREPKVVFKETLKPGERLVISHLPPPIDGRLKRPGA